MLQVGVLILELLRMLNVVSLHTSILIPERCQVGSAIFLPTGVRDVIAASEQFLSLVKLSDHLLGAYCLSLMAVFLVPL